jgi:predicted esterase
VASSWCWPTNQQAVDAESAALFAEWKDAEARIEDAIGARLSRRYVLGFSNGGYFAAFLSVEALFPIDGAGVVGAGRTFVDESLTGAARPPFYIAVGANEAESTRRDAEHLASVLSLRGFPTEYVVHAGRGHELREDDLESAWLTWRAAR